MIGRRPAAPPSPEEAIGNLTTAAKDGFSRMVHNGGGSETGSVLNALDSGVPTDQAAKDLAALYRAVTGSRSVEAEWMAATAAGVKPEGCRAAVVGGIVRGVAEFGNELIDVIGEPRDAPDADQVEGFITKITPLALARDDIVVYDRVGGRFSV